jgi:hypothetical protein
MKMGFVYIFSSEKGGARPTTVYTGRQMVSEEELRLVAAFKRRQQQEAKNHGVIFQNPMIGVVKNRAKLDWATGVNFMNYEQRAANENAVFQSMLESLGKRETPVF